MATWLRWASLNISSGSRLPSMCMWSSALGRPAMKAVRSVMRATVAAPLPCWLVRLVDPDRRPAGTKYDEAVEHPRPVRGDRLLEVEQHARSRAEALQPRRTGIGRLAGADGERRLQRTGRRLDDGPELAARPAESTGRGRKAQREGAGSVGAMDIGA